MARPSNDGLDYFPLDVDYFGDIKIMRVSEQFGDAGELAALKLTAWIYKSGYAVEWDEVAERIFARRVMFNPALPIHEIVECLLDVGYFDRDLYQRRGVLTSRGIQKRYLTCIDRRREVELDRRLLLVRPEDYGFTLPDPIEGVNRVIAVNAGKKPKRQKEEKPAASYDIEDALDRARKLDPNKTKRQ